MEYNDIFKLVPANYSVNLISPFQRAVYTKEKKQLSYCGSAIAECVSQWLKNELYQRMVVEPAEMSWFDSQIKFLKKNGWDLVTKLRKLKLIVEKPVFHKFGLGTPEAEKKIKAHVNERLDAALKVAQTLEYNPLEVQLQLFY